MPNKVSEWTQYIDCSRGTGPSRAGGRRPVSQRWPVGSDRLSSRISVACPRESGLHPRPDRFRRVSVCGLADRIAARPARFSPRPFAGDRDGRALTHWARYVSRSLRYQFMFTISRVFKVQYQFMHNSRLLQHPKWSVTECNGYNDQA